MLATKSSRWLTIIGVIFALSAVSYWHYSNFYIWPSRYYGFTQKDTQQIDIRSPNGKAIIDIELSSFRPDTIAFKLQMERCSLENINPTNNGGIIAGEHRGVYLCNTGRLEGKDFDVAFSYFKERVNEIYYNLYSRIALDIAYYLFLAFFLWCCIWGALKAIRWANRGDAGSSSID